MVFWLILGFNLLLTFGFILGIIAMKRFKLTEFYPKVSIIIAVWNEEKTIEKCIAGILKQDYKNKYEILIAGGGSDKTPEICKKLAKKYKNIRYFYEKASKGKYQALNLAIGKAKNDIIIILDADTQLEKDWLRILIRPLEDEKVDFSYGMQLPVKESRQHIMMVYMFQLFCLGLNQVKWYCWGNGANMAFRKKVWKRLNGFKNILLEDIWFNYEAVDKGFKGIFSPRSFVLARFPENYEQQYKRNSRFFRGTLELMKKFPLNALPLSFVMLWPISLLASIFNLKSFIINIAFLIFWYFLINLTNKKLKITLKEAAQTVIQMLLLVLFAVPYTLEWFNPKKKKEWTRV